MSSGSSKAAVLSPVNSAAREKRRERLKSAKSPSEVGCRGELSSSVPSTLPRPQLDSNNSTIGRSNNVQSNTRNISSSNNEGGSPLLGSSKSVNNITSSSMIRKPLITSTPLRPKSPSKNESNYYAIALSRLDNENNILGGSSSINSSSGGSPISVKSASNGTATTIISNTVNAASLKPRKTSAASSSSILSRIATEFNNSASGQSSSTSSSIPKPSKSALSTPTATITISASKQQSKSTNSASSSNNPNIKMSDSSAILTRNVTVGYRSTNNNNDSKKSVASNDSQRTLSSSSVTAENDQVFTSNSKSSSSTANGHGTTSSSYKPNAINTYGESSSSNNNRSKQHHAEASPTISQSPAYYSATSASPASVYISPMTGSPLYPLENTSSTKEPLKKQSTLLSATASATIDQIIINNRPILNASPTNASTTTTSSSSTSSRPPRRRKDYETVVDRVASGVNTPTGSESASSSSNSRRSSEYSSAAESLDENRTPRSSVHNLQYLANLPNGTALPSNFTYMKQGSTIVEEVKQRKSSAGVAVTPTPPTVDQGRSGAPQLTKRASSIKSVGGIFKANFSMITAAVPLAADSKNSPSFAGATSDRHSITRSSDSSSEFYSPIGSPLQPSSKRSSDVPVMAHPVAIKNVNLDRFAAAVPTGADHSSGVGNGRANGNANVHANGYVTKKSCPEFHPEVTCLLQMIPSKARKYKLPSNIPRFDSTFTNFGNTCFMNSVLQCILASDELMAFFNSNSYKKDINLKSRMKGGLAEAMNELWTKFKEGKSSLRPYDLRKQLISWAPQFDNYEQHDGQECLRMLLDGLHEDLNRIKMKPKFTYPEAAEEQLNPIGKAELAWNRYYSICNSQIFDVFGGQFESVIRCDTCSFESPTYEPFWDLSLPIPAPDANGNVTLASCLKEFGKRESLEAEWNCSRCKTRRSATKSISIFRCPEILVIHLNRFRFDSYIVRKLSTDVSFPLKNLSLSSILSPRRKQAFGSVIDQSDLSSSSSNFSSDDQQQNPDPKYELYATVNHFGVANGGHYTAYCKYEGEKWFVKDDNTVRGLASNSISGPSTYILFFRRTKTTTAM